MEQKPYENRRIKPKKSSDFPIGLVVGGGLLGALIIIAGIFVAAGGGGGANIASPTPVPAPVLDNTALAAGVSLYATQEQAIHLSILPRVESDIRVPLCGEVIILDNLGESNFFFYDTTGNNQYWLFVVNVADGVNGWLPMNQLALDVPDDCD